MLLHPLATSTDHGGPRTSDLSIERRRRNHFTTAPLLNITSKAKVHLMHSALNSDQNMAKLAFSNPQNFAKKYPMKHLSALELNGL